MRLLEGGSRERERGRAPSNTLSNQVESEQEELFIARGSGLWVRFYMFREYCTYLLTTAVVLDVVVRSRVNKKSAGEWSEGR